MTSVTMKLNMKEMELLSSLVSDQLFRREFIDSRVPGCRFDPGDLRLGKELVARFRTMTDRAKGITSPQRNVTTA